MDGEDKCCRFELAVCVLCCGVLQSRKLVAFCFHRSVSMKLLVSGRSVGAESVVSIVEPSPHTGVRISGINREQL